MSQKEQQVGRSMQIYANEMESLRELKDSTAK
jgi:hypothetical protein